MKSNKFNSKFKTLIDNFFILNLFLVILSSIFFLFALMMQINGYTLFLSFFRRIWDPFILSSITILITSAVLSGITSWLKNKVLLEDKDI